MLAVKGPNSRADAYGVLAGADYSGVHLIIQVNQEDRPDADAGAVSEVSFDVGDVQGTFRVPGHPGVIGLWLASSSSSPLSDPITSSTLDPFSYTVSEAAGDAAFMFARGFVWPPGEWKRAYP